MVGCSMTSRTGSVTPSSSWTADAILIAEIDVPPSSKKLSPMPMSGWSSTRRQIRYSPISTWSRGAAALTCPARVPATARSTSAPATLPLRFNGSRSNSTTTAGIM